MKLFCTSLRATYVRGALQNPESIFPKCVHNAHGTFNEVKRETLIKRGEDGATGAITFARSRLSAFNSLDFSPLRSTRYVRGTNGVFLLRRCVAQCASDCAKISASHFSKFSVHLLSEDAPRVQTLLTFLFVLFRYNAVNKVN